jgi:hypothetical protein
MPKKMREGGILFLVTKAVKLISKTLFPDTKNGINFNIYYYVTTTFPKF